jgi:hypothetical protein
MDTKQLIKARQFGAAPQHRLNIWLGSISPVRFLAKQFISVRLGLLVTGMVLPLTVFAVVLVYYDYEGDRRTAYDRILQIARGVASNIDAEFRAAIASLEVLSLSEALERDDLPTFRKQAEHFVNSHFPQSDVVVSDASGQQLLNTAVPAGTLLPRYTRIEALRHVFEKGEPQISDLLSGHVLRRNIAAVDVPVWRDGKVAYDLAASLPLSIFTDIFKRQRPEPDWTIAVFDREGTVIARSRDNEQFVGRRASPTLYAGLVNPTRGHTRHDHLRGNRGSDGVHSRTTIRVERCCRNPEIIPHV